jgi:ubiquinone biosynthesis protein COQ9
MGWKRSEVEVYHTIDLSDYDDEVMDYVQPDNIEDALELLERWGFGDGDILDYMLESMDEQSFLSRVSDVLTVETALELVKNVYEYGRSIQVRNLEAKSNQINELKEKVDDLLAMNHTIIKDQEQEKKEDMGYEL